MWRSELNKLLRVTFHIFTFYSIIPINHCLHSEYSTTALPSCPSISTFASSNNMIVGNLAVKAPDTQLQWMPVTCGFAYSWSDNTTGSTIHSAFCNVSNQWQTAFNCIRMFCIINSLSFKIKLL